MNEFGLSDNAIKVFNDLYSFQGESVKDSFTRVAKEFATNDEEFKLAFNLLSQNIWRPNTPVWMNSNRKNKIYSACYVTGLDDSMDSIYDVANVARKIFQRGAGIGIPIGNLREKDAYIYEGELDVPPEGRSSGPICFMKLYDSVAETTKSGGRTRRAAILCGMPIWHPDIMDFIRCKETDGVLSNMNISVAVTNKFMDSLKDGISFPLISPSNGKMVKEINAQEIWDSLCFYSHRTADPGILFIDNINKFNPIKKHYLVEVPNPCLVGNTLVKTDKGDVEIKDVVVGDKVLSYNTITNETEWDTVMDSFMTRKNANVVKIELEDGGILELTPGHKIFTENRGYIKTSQLTEEDILLCVEK